MERKVKVDALEEIILGEIGKEEFILAISNYLSTDIKENMYNDFINDYEIDLEEYGISEYL